MKSQTLINKSGQAEEPKDLQAEWINSLISRNRVRMECVRYPDESEAHCQKRIMAAMWVFVGLLVILSAVVVCLLRSKI
ncbi:MAG TPA: hypothetical protein VH595_17450 [Verrucomicrobiae bacterium]|jgi:hypothetical protein|nr:hypothetical protein [Verrucomicrobiae bacterium]